MAVKRNIIEIDESLCTGCGNCVTDCAEGAIEIIDGKARLISDNLCDGLGACMGSCPENALKIIQREAVPFDEEEVEKKLKHQSSCPSLKMAFANGTWPLQFLLLSPDSDVFDRNNILISADCVSHALKSYHETVAKDKRIVIGCPKLDNIDEYRNRFMYIFKNRKLSSLSLVKMEVPCCSGMEKVIRECIAESGRNIRLDVITVTTDGKIKQSI